jgi:LysM repeat protein
MHRWALALATTVLVTMLAGCIRDSGDPEATNTPDDVFVVVTLTPRPSPTVRTEIVAYEVQDGDTLYGIAAEFDIDPEELIRINGLANPDSIFVGQTLSIPAPIDATPVP